MKKPITMTAMAATASAVVLMASCAEEELSWSDSSSEQQTVILPVDDLTFGYNSIITETDSLTSVRIPLNTDVTVKVESRNGYVDLQCVKVDGKYYLQVANPAQAKLGVDEVTLTVKGHPELTKRFLFTVNDSQTLTRAANEDALKKRFADVFSLGQYIWMGPSEAHPSAPMLNADVLSNGLSDIEGLDIIFEVDPLQPITFESRKVEGSTMEEHENNWALSLGLNNIPIKAAAQYNLSASFSKKSASKHYFEYMTETKDARCASAHLTLGTLAIPACDSLWKRLISRQLDDVLNNPGSNLYKMFSEDIDGACEIIDSYGSHLLTYCVLGTNAKVQYRKKSDLTNTSMEWAVKLEIDKKKEDLKTDSGGKKYSADAVAAAEYINNSRSPKGSIGYTQSTKDYLEEIEMEMTYTLVGGNALETTNASEWKPTEDPANWFPVQYQATSANTTILRAIYELCQDSTSVRYKTLQKAINDCNTDSINYFAAWKARKNGISLTEPETEWILAGVYVDVNASTSDSYRPSPVKRTLGDGKTKCTFYPYIDLAFKDGRCLDTETSDFGRCFRYDAHYWYYAMMMRDDFLGLEDIKLIDKGHKKDYINEGYYSCLNDGAEDFGDGWSCNETNDFILMAKPIEEGDLKAKPITGLRLEAFRSKDKVGTNEVLGVSGGTGRSANGANSKRYKRYWVEDWQNKVKFVTSDENKIEPVYYLSWIHQPWYVFLATIKTPIRHEDAYLEYPTDMPRAKE